jgi:Tripartite tricarboxylate transporter family receptor
VPYRDTGPVMNDLLGKQVDMTCDQATNTTGPILSKQAKAYAITTKSRAYLRCPTFPPPTKPVSKASSSRSDTACSRRVARPPRSCKNFPRRSSAR